MVAVSSWGKTACEHRVVRLSHLDSIAKQLNQPVLGIAYGMGRSYGDACLNPDQVLWNTQGLNHFIHFDEDQGHLTCEAGVLLGDIQRLFIPRGWGLPVTPGTQFVTLGGAIANDVHGKNHHRLGSFGHHVLRLKLLRTDGEVIECGPQNQEDWFAATLGGVGLTGVIVEATIQLRPLPSAWLEVESLPYGNIQEFFQLADLSQSAWEYTLSWLDSRKGRGIFFRANSASIASIGSLSVNPSNLEFTFPMRPPFSLINSFTLKPLNWAYYQAKKRKKNPYLEHYQSFFYPLDRVLGWNKIYGNKGFFQYQMVIPFRDREAVLSCLLDEIARFGQGSFLTVLKTLSDQPSLGMLSFPKPGVTLALDFPNHKGILTLFRRLDSLVGKAGGRIYLAKDACMSKELFELGYPRLNEFFNYRDPGISSALSRRLMGS